MATRESEPTQQIIADELFEEQAIETAQVEGDDCEHVSEEGQVPPEEAENYSALDDEELGTLDELSEAKDEGAAAAEAARLAPQPTTQPRWRVQRLGGARAPRDPSRDRQRTDSDLPQAPDQQLRGGSQHRPEAVVLG